MNRIELYKQTEEVLYQAYFDDTLRHGDCTACAVGNICKAPAKKLQLENYLWRWRFYTDGRYQLTNNLGFGNHIYKEADELISASGYTQLELMRIEFAFETASIGFNDEDWMFNGLVAVLEVLKDIHGITETGIERFAAVHEGRRSA